MSLPRYPEYKDSGVAWLGDVPGHWEVTSLKRSFQIIGGSTPKSDKADYWDGSVVWVSPADLSKLTSIYIDDSARKITDEGLASCGTTLVPSGSIVLSTRAPIGSLAIAATSLCTNQGCKALVPRNTVSSRFFAYLLLAATDELNIRGRGTTFLELSADELGAFKATLPGSNEQTAIATFLDHETAKIDTLIAEQEKLLTLLAEKRQATISHAVTKGLNPDAPMKDSGVEWLGKVPAHWVATRLGHLVRQIVDGAHFTPTYVDEGVPFLRVTDITSPTLDLSEVKRIPETEHIELSRRCYPKKGDLLLSKNGTIGVPRVISWDWEFSIFVSLCLIKLGPKLSVHFAAYVFQSSTIQIQIEDGKKQSTVTNLHLEKIAGFKFPVPPLEEQLDIVRYLDNETTRLDALTTEATRAIDLLKERRTALISAAVTGKIDVRYLANQEAT